MISPVVLHEPAPKYAYPLSETSLRLLICLPPESWTRVLVRFRNKNRPDDPWHFQAMDLTGFDGMLSCYEKTLHTHEKCCYLIYDFRLETETETWFLCAHGLSKQEPAQGHFEFLCPHESQLPKVPAWAKGAVVYQIFPDRFARDTFVADGRPLKLWSELPDSKGFWGGNLQGILSKVPYLKELGVDAVYLNPVFRSVSNHRYDTADYLSVDPLLGTEKDLKLLADELHQHGLRFMLDGVFNHCGVDFPPFQDVERNGRASPYWKWFNVSSYPLSYDPPNYEAIGYYRAMPKLNQANPQVQSYFLSVAEKWTRLLQLDGWRLDVADEIDPEFLSRLQKLLRQINPDILLLGEAWQENAAMTSAGMLSGIINYPLHRAMAAFFAQDNITAEAFACRVSRSLTAYPSFARDLNVCMLDCHDTPRFWSLCQKSLSRLRCALAFLLLWPGINLIYYGDEAGLEGGGDPDCRRTMPWDTADDAVKQLYASYIRLRKRLRNGAVTLETTYLPVIAIRAVFKENTVWAFIHMGEPQSVTVPLESGEHEVMFGCDTVRMQHQNKSLFIHMDRQACVVLNIPAVQSAAISG